jgi:hypothetical protein
METKLNSIQRYNSNYAVHTLLPDLENHSVNSVWEITSLCFGNHVKHKAYPVARIQGSQYETCWYVQ